MDGNGEPGPSGVLPAVVNAVAALMDTRIGSLPLAKAKLAATG
jgi:CO/xanthine dehydrogenase Mo-binding subunit